MSPKTTTALLLAAALLAFAPSASANHTRCHNEPDDLHVPDLAGIDGPQTDSNGFQVCVLHNVYSVETLDLPLGLLGTDDSTPPAGTGVAVRVCHNTGTSFDECNDVTGGATVLLDWTGVVVSCGVPTVSVCVWIDGAMLRVL